MKHLKFGMILFFLVCCSVIGILIIRIYPLLGSDGIFMPSCNKMKRVLRENKVLLTDVALQIESMGSDSVRWDAIEDEKIVIYTEDNAGGYSHTDINIDDQELSDNLKKVKEKRFQNVFKQSNYIMFVKWSSLDSSAGLIYCYDTPKVLEAGETNITEIDHNWYYFSHRS